MKTISYRNSAVLFSFSSIVFAALLVFDSSVTSQPREKRVNANSSAAQNRILSEAVSTSTPAPVADVVKVDVDLVKVDALVLEKKTARAADITLHSSRRTRTVTAQRES